MAITLGSVTFDAAHTTVREKYEEVGGRDARHIEISGVIMGLHSVADIEAQLDAILDAASAEAYDAALSVRDGRRLWVRRAKYTREVSRDSLVGSFTLALDANNPFEESTSLSSVSWTLAGSGATKSVTAHGNVFSPPTISMQAVGIIVNPSFSDGTRTIAYSGTVGTGKILVFDGASGSVLLDGEDVTPYTTGAFPQIAPEGTVLRYVDDPASSHTASVNATYRDRWW